MKNSTNKIIAAAVCGLITGAVGISLTNKGEDEVHAAGHMDDDYMMDEENEHDFRMGEDDEFMMDEDNNHDEEDREEQGDRQMRGNHKRGHHHGEEDSLEETEGIDVVNGKYKDGTYSGTSSGYAKGLKVDVTIANGKISEVKVVSHNETPGFCEKAIETIPAKIVEAQSTNIDTVSGETYSSKVILKAVNDALKTASTNDSNNNSDNDTNNNLENDSNNDSSNNSNSEENA